MPVDRLLHPKCGKSHKVSLLTDLEFRVWTQYLLSADDFGVMHATAVQLQSDNLHLARRPVKMIQRCLDAMIKAGLLHDFRHQGERYVFSHNWQLYQKVEYPRATQNPKPTDEALALCDEPTRALFTKHPGGQRKDRRRSEDAPNDSARASRTYPESVPPTRAHGRAERLTANGVRQAANGQRPTADGEYREGKMFPADVAIRELQAVYPPQRVTSGHRTESAFMDELLSGEPQSVFSTMLANLENHKRSHEWRVKGMVPSLENWLKNGLWKREMDEQPPSSEQMTSKTALTAHAVASILKEPA